jgi:tetratricopeptide (TPR) repeat protein
VKELAALDETIKLPAMQDFKVHHNESGELLQLARDLAAGDLDLAQKDSDAAIKKFQDAVAVQDKLAYSEPENWYYPARQSLGDALLKAGRNAEAETVFREDVKRHPDNGWSLYGLQQSLRAQGKTAEADEVQRRLEKAWARADVKLTAAVF